MPEENKLLGLYNKLKENKPDIPSYEAFRKMMNNGSKRKEVYNKLKENKPDIPSYEAFQNMIGPYLGITDNENDNDSAKLTNMQEEYSDRKKDRIQRRQEKYRKEKQEDIDKRIAEINQNKDTYLKETEDTMPDRIYDEFNKANEEYGMMLDEWKKKRGIIQPAVMGAQNVTTVTAPHKTDKLLKLEKQLQAYKEIGYSAYYDYMNEKYPQEGILHEYDNEKQQDITEDAFEAFRRTDTGKAYIDDIGKRQKEIIAYGKDGFMNSEIGIEANKEIDKTKEENKKYEILHDALNKYYQDLFDKDEYLSNINKSMIESFDVMFGDMITEARMPSIRQSVRGIIDEKRNEYQKIYDDNGSIFKGMILDYFAAQVPGGKDRLKATGHKDTNIQAAIESLIKDSERKIQAATERRGFGKGVADIALQWETWSAGIADLMNNITLKNVIDKYEESENPEEELTPEEQLLVESYYTNSLVTSYFGDMIKKGYNIGNVTGESLPFMLEMFTTAAVSGTLTKGLTRWVGKKLGADVVKEAIERQGKRGVLRNIAGAYDEIGGLQFLKAGAGKIAEASVKGLGHSLTAGAPRSAAIAFEEMTGDSDIEIDYDREKGEWKFEYKGQKDQTEKVLALYRGIMETSIEFGTEYMGEAFSDLMRAGAKAFALDKIKLYKELSKAYRNTKIGKAAQAVYFDGMLEENMEEWAGSLLRSILEPEKYNITEEFSGENIADTFMGLLPMSIAFGVFGGVNAGRNYINNRKKAVSAEEMIRQYNPEYLDTWKSLMYMSNDDGRNYVTDRIATISDEIKSIDKDDTLSQEEKNSLKQKKATELMALQVKWEQILMDEAASVKEDEDTRRFLQNIVPYINRKTGNLEMVNIDIDGEIKTMAVINNDDEQYMLMGEDGKVIYKEKTVVDAIPENEWNIIKGSDIINEIEERRKYINLNPYDRYGIDIKPVKGSVMTDVEGKAIKMPDSESEIIVDDVYDDGYVDISWIDNNGNMEMLTLSEREYKDYAIKHVEDNMKYQTYLINTITSGENVGSLLLNPETGEMSENAIRDANYYLKKEKEILVENKVDISELEYIIENNDFENIAKIMQTLDEETREHLLKYVYYKKIDNAIMLNARQYVTLLDKQNREATERKIWNENGNGKINQFEHNGKLYYVKGANDSSMYYVVDSNGNNVENGTDSDIVNSFISSDKVDGKIIEISPEDVNYNSNGEQYLSGVAKVIENYHELSQGEEYTIYDKNNRPTDIIIQGSDENGNIIYTKRDSKKLLTMPENDMRKSIDDYEHEQMLNENRKESDRRKGLEELKNGDTFILVYNGQLYKNARYKNKNSLDKLNYISLSGELGKRDTVKLTDEELSNARNAALDMISEQEKQQEMATSIIENEEQKQAVKIAITEFGKTLHAEENGVVFIDSIDELPQNYAGNLARNTEVVEGYYDPETGKIYIVLDVIIDNKTADEALQRGKQVIFHELVAHKTLRDILNGFGDRYYDSFLQGVFNGMNEKDTQFYARYVWDYVLGNKTKGNSWEALSNDERYDVVNKHRAIIADEYIARLSETVLLDKGSENDKSTWRQILDWFKRFIEQSFGIRIEFSDDDITRMLFASKAKLEQNENIDIDNDTETNISILENKFKESRKILSYLNAKIKQTDKKIKELNKQNDEIDNSLEADSKEWDIAKTDIYVKIDQLQKEKQWLSDLSRKYSEYLSEMENAEQEKQIDESEQENNEEQEFNPKKQTLSERAYILSNKEDYLGIDDRIKISIVLNKTKFRWNNEKGRGLGDLVRFSNSERKSRLGILNNKNGYSIENFVEYLQSQEGDSLLDVVSRQDYFELMKITEEILLDYNTYSDMIESVEDKISEIESRYEEMARQNPYYEDKDYNITEFKKDDYFNFTDDDIEVPFSVNEKNDVFEQKDKNYQNEYRTKDGRNIRYNSQAQLSMDFEESDVTGRVVDNNIQQQDVSEVIRLYDSGLKDDIICHVERVFTETGDFDFTGTQKIENATDVAYIFKQLENYAIENSFAVIVKNGNPIVLHLGMGKTGTTIIDTVPIIESTKRLNPEKVYFIHNHPSGNIMASKEDVQILNSLRKSLGDIVQDGIIINTLSGMYGTFSESSTESHINETDKDTYPIKVYRFSKQVFNKSYNPNVKLNNQYEVAKYISSQRLGNRAKLNYLVLNNSGHVVANVFTPLSYKSSYNDIAKHVVNNSLVAGGASGIIIYGNNTDILNMFSISKLIREYSIGNLSLLDIVDVQGNYNNVFDNNETYKNTDIRFSIKENKNEKPAMFSVTPLPDSLEEAERRAWEDMLGSNTIFRTANKVYSNWFDSTNAVKKLQEAISQTRGIEITPDLNVRDMLVCEQSVIRAGIDKKEIEFIKPLQKAVENLVKKGATYEHITDYLIAKHGLERNEYFQRKLQEEYDKEYEKELNKKPNAKREIAELKDNAGLTGLARKYGFDENKFTEVAENIVSEFENKYDVNEIWDKIKAMTNDMLDTRLDAGLLSKESYDYIKNMYDYYIPLRGWGEEMTSSIYDYRNKTTLESSYTPVDKKAKGRTSLAYDPVSELILMMGNSVEFSAKNKTRQALLKLADISDTELLTIKRAFSLNSVNEDTRNMVESKGIEEKDGGLLKIDGKIVDPNNKNEHYITVYVNGNPYVIEVEGSPEVWQAFNPPARDFTQSKIGGLTRFYSMINTTFDVSFALGNIARDFRSAIFLSFVNGGLGYTKDIIKYMAVGGSNMVSLMNGRCKDKKLQQYWDEFVQGGGETGFTRQINAEDIHKDMLKLAGYAKRNSVGKVADTVGEAIEKAMDGWNRYFEDMPRFAAFLANRENGKSIEESVMAAKEITVNFNIKGASPASGLARGLYSFFNASLQGFNTYLKAAKKNPLRFGIALSTITFTGFLVPLLNMWLLSVFGDDDDWREYENLTTYTGNNNTVIFLGKDNGFLKIPHPQETRLFSSLGNMFFRNYMGWNHGESMESQVFGMIMDFMPMNIYEGGDSKNYNLIGGVVTALTPSFFKPLSEAGFNRDYLGRKIYKEQQYSNQPRWTLAYDDVNPISLWFTRILSGNDNARNHYINISPDLIDHVVTGYTGGAGRYLGSLIKFANYLANEDNEWKNEKPFIRRFHQADTPKQVEYAINRGYRDIKNIFQDSKHSWDIYKKDPINKNAVKFIDTEEYAIYDALTWEAQKVYVDKKGRIKPSKKRDGRPAIKESNYISDIDKLEKEYKEMLEITDSDKKPTEKELEEMYNLIQRQKKSVIDLVYWTTIEYRKRKHDFSQWQKKTSEHRYTESEAIRNLEETMNRK